MKGALLLQRHRLMPLLYLVGHLINLQSILGKLFTLLPLAHNAQEVHCYQLFLQHLLEAHVGVLVIQAYRYLAFVLSCDPGVLQCLLR